MKRVMMAWLIILLILLSGCGEAGVTTRATASASSAAGSPVTTAARPLSVAYICRDLQHPWYKRISQAMEARCREAGIEYRSEDCLNRDDLFLKNVDTYLHNRTDALIVSPTNEGIGPVVTTKCAEAKMPLLSIDARLKYPDGRNASYIGRSAYDCGVAGAREMISQAKARGFFQSRLEIIELTISSFYHVSQMVSGFDRTLKLEAPVDLNGSTVVIEAVDDSFSAQYLTLTRTLTEFDPERKYIAFTYNDDGALAFYRFALERGIDFRNVLICGVGGYEPSFAIFTKAGERSASYFAVSISATEIGRQSIDIVRDANSRKTALPESTTVPAALIRVTNFRSQPESQSLGSSESLAQMETFYNWKIS